MNQDWIVLLQQQSQLGKVMETNQKTAPYGLFLSEQDAELLIEEHHHALQEQKRVEFGGGITQIGRAHV